jgi:chorismate synthase
MANSFGKIFTVTSFGESHGHCVGVLIDGCPAGLPMTQEEIQKEVDRRKPVAAFSTTRNEPEQVEILSGIFNGYTTGAPICLQIWNRDIDSSSYEKIKNLPRPGHSDYAARIKYGGFNDYRGGGRFSGRITAGFIMAGAIAKKLLRRQTIEIFAHTIEIGGIKAGKKSIDEIKRSADGNTLRCADPEAAQRMMAVITQAQTKGDSVGGIIESIAVNVPAGLGEPVFDTLDGELAKALFAIPAVKGVEFGAGFGAAGLKGSENNDSFTMERNAVVTLTNNAGGILGGMTSGMPVVLRVAIKPTPSISIPQQTINTDTMSNDIIEVTGRHDACIVPRAVPVVESMVAITLCDFSLRRQIIPEVLQ